MQYLATTLFTILLGGGSMVAAGPEQPAYLALAIVAIAIVSLVLSCVWIICRRHDSRNDTDQNSD